MTVALQREWASVQPFGRQIKGLTSHRNASPSKSLTARQ
jgi:hypothetical protein